ncbi:MAG: response regulator [Candidatus Zixiibacteriota bacterium]
MPPANRQVLWVDDEIEMLAPHFVFLQERGYDVTKAHSGDDALELVQKQRFDLVLLDEQMPGMDGLSTLEGIKRLAPNLPVVMVTKSEEERIMDQAIGQKIDDYLTKPVNPSQILSVIKRLLERRKIQSEHLAKKYVDDFNLLREALSPDAHWQEWLEAHLLLSRWDLDLDLFVNLGLDQTHREHKREWNVEFGRWFEREYPGWLANLDSAERPPLSIDVVPRWLTPHLRAGRKVYFFVIDCMTLDQWIGIEPEIAEYFQIERDLYFSILPSATPFSRNAIFSGLFADEIQRLYPELWQIGDKDEFSRNRLERQLLDQQLDRLGVRLASPAKYVKVLDFAEGDSIARKFSSYKDTPLLSVVYNFIDHLAHGRSEDEILQELAPNEAAFRGLMRTWFVNSSWFKVLRKIAREPDAVAVVTTDHGSILGTKGTMAHGRRDTSASLRYKFGDSLNANVKDAVVVQDPRQYRLPKFSSNTTYLLAREDYYFVYPTNFNEYQRKFANTFVHGGISLPELVLPVATLKPR